MPASDFAPPPVIVAAPVVSAWYSKINWVQALSIACMILTSVSAGKLNITPEQQVALITGIGTVFAIVTSVIRTFFTTTIIAASATALPPAIISKK